MVFRIEKNKNYTVMSNYHLRDKNLSLKTKGLLSIMLSLPDDWDYSIAGLTTICKDGESAVRSALKELEEHGYLKRERVYESGKIIDWNYIVYEQPNIDQDVENLDVENQHVGFRTQLNTNKQNTENKNDIISKDIISSEKASEFNFGKQSPKKPNLYQKCISLIDAWTDLPEIRTPLLQYLDLCMEMKCIRGANQWKGMLKTLERVQEQCHPHTFEEIIEQSINRGYKTFYPINDYRTTKAPDNVKSIKMTAEEKEELYRLAEEREQNGQVGYY